MTYDLLFSYWLLIWFILYYFKFIQYNPKWLFIISIIYISIVIITMISKHKNLSKVFIFFIIGIIFKVIPLYLIRNTVTTYKDIIFGIILFLVYFLWVSYRRGVNKVLQIYTVDVFKFKTPIMNIYG